VDSAPEVILGTAAARTKKYSPDKRRNRSQRGGSRPHLSGIRHAGPDLPWACRDRLQDEVRQSRSLRSSVSIWTTTTRSSQRSWIFCSRFARTRILAGLASTEHPLPVRRSTRVRCKIRCPFGSVSGNSRIIRSCRGLRRRRGSARCRLNVGMTTGRHIPIPSGEDQLKISHCGQRFRCPSDFTDFGNAVAHQNRARNISGSATFRAPGSSAWLGADCPEAKAFP